MKKNNNKKYKILSFQEMVKYTIDALHSIFYAIEHLPEDDNFNKKLEHLQKSFMNLLYDITYICNVHKVDKDDKEKINKIIENIIGRTYYLDTYEEIHSISWGKIHDILDIDLMPMINEVAYYAEFNEFRPSKNICLKVMTKFIDRYESMTNHPKTLNVFNMAKIMDMPPHIMFNILQECFRHEIVYKLGDKGLYINV